MRIPIDSSLIRRGDLLEGVIAAAALLLMVVLRVPLWLALPLAVVTYVGLRLVFARRGRDDDAVGDSETPTRPYTAHPLHPGEWTVVPEVAERFGLTPRECEVLPLLAQRLTDREIAEHLCRSERTVMNHVSRILSKLELVSRRDVARFSMQHGLLLPPLPASRPE